MFKHESNASSFGSKGLPTEASVTLRFILMDLNTVDFTLAPQATA